MPTVKIQRTSLLEAQELHGVVIRCVMVSRVVGLTDNDYTALFSALAEAGIPAAGSTLTGADNLRLSERNPKLIEKGVVDVNLVYKTDDENQGQDIDSPLTGRVVGSVSVNVQQVETNLDADGQPISLSHTWPSGDAKKGQTDTQGGKVQRFVAQRVLTVQGLKSTTRPWLLANALVGNVNLNTWSGEGPREWMCMNVNWSILDRVVASKYWVEFSFQHNPDTWDPTAVFIDPRTGAPPPGLVENVGYKTIQHHKGVDFEGVIGTRVHGA